MCYTLIWMMPAAGSYLFSAQMTARLYDHELSRSVTPPPGATVLQRRGRCCHIPSPKEMSMQLAVCGVFMWGSWDGAAATAADGSSGTAPAVSCSMFVQQPGHGALKRVETVSRPQQDMR